MGGHSHDCRAGMNCLSSLMTRKASRKVEIKTIKEITDILREHKGDGVSFCMPFWDGP